MLSQNKCILRSVNIYKNLYHQKIAINFLIKRNKAYFKLQPQEYLDGIAKKGSQYTEVESNKFIKHRLRPFIPYFEAQILKFTDNVYMVYIGVALILMTVMYFPFSIKKLNEQKVLEYYCPPEKHEPDIYKMPKVFF